MSATFSYWMRVRDGFPMTSSEEKRHGKARAYGRTYHVFDNDGGMGPPACGMLGAWGDDRLGGRIVKCAMCEAVLRSLERIARNDVNRRGIMFIVRQGEGEHREDR